MDLPPIDRVTLGRMQNPVRGLLHGSAAVVAVAGTLLLGTRADAGAQRIAVVVFGLGLVALYTTSSLYHSVPWSDAWKRRMQRLDHAMIFVLIAGTFTAVSAIALDGAIRVASLAGAWLIAGVGIGQQIFFPRERNNFAIALMTTLGWLGALLVPSLARRTGIDTIVLLFAGGVLYTVGMVMLVTERPRLWPKVFSYHEAFHVLVVAASTLHFATIYRSLLPAG